MKMTCLICLLVRILSVEEIKGRPLQGRRKWMRELAVMLPVVFLTVV